jgi:hypothetical protein
MEPCRNEVSQDRHAVERLRNADFDLRQTIVDTQATIDESHRLIRLASKMANPNISAETEATPRAESQSVRRASLLERAASSGNLLHARRLGPFSRLVRYEILKDELTLASD